MRKRTLKRVLIMVVLVMLMGWHVAIMMGFQAKGAVPPGATSLEKAVKASAFMEAFKERGIEYTVAIQ